MAFSQLVKYLVESNLIQSNYIILRMANYIEDGWIFTILSFVKVLECVIEIVRVTQVIQIQGTAKDCSLK